MNADIYGFGKWVDHAIQFNPDGFTVIYGENESGKSTLHQFVLFMLFGMPPKQRNFYRPKKSGKMGGRLTVKDPNVGVFTIERRDEVSNGAAICYTADGKEWGEAWLNDQLKGLTKKSYQSIFSFSSLDLHRNNDMKEDDLAEVLLGIGMTGSAAIYAAEKRLDQQMNELYKPRGTKPLINKKLTSLDHLHSQLQQAVDTEKTYRSLKERQGTLTNEISEYQQRIDKEREALRTIEKQQQALPYIREYMAAEKQLEAFPAELHFPEQGIARMEKIKDNLLPLKSEQNILQDNQRKYEQKMKSLQQQVDDSPWDQVTGLLKKKDEWEQRNRELTQLEQSLDKTNAQMQNKIIQLDGVIDQKDAAEMHLAFHTEREWQDIKDSKEKIKLEKEKVEQEKEELNKQTQYVESEKVKLKAQLLPEQQKKELQEKVSNFQEQILTRKLQENYANQKAKMEKNKQVKQKRAKLILAGCLLTGAVIGGAGFFFEAPLLYIFMVTAFLFGTLLWYTERKSLSEWNELLKEDVGKLQRKKITPEIKEEAEQLLSLNETRLLEWNGLKDQLKSLNLQQLKWEEKRKFIDGKTKRLQKQIKEQIAQYPFLEKIEVRYWPEMYHRLKLVFELVRDKKELRRKIEILKAEITAFQEEADTYMGEERKLSQETSFGLLEEKLESVNNLYKQIAHYKEQMNENSDQQDTLKQKLQIYENEMAALLDSADVSTEDEFYEKARQLEEKMKAAKDRLKASEQIARILPGADMQSIPDESTLKAKQKHTNTTIGNLEKILEKKRDELAKINAGLENLEASESHSSLMHQMEMKKEALNHLAKKWAVLKTAKETLLETKRNYRDKYLHKVMEKTTDYFTRLTAGRYTKLFAPGKGSSFYAVASDHARYHVNELSRGTIDQLYVSLRLAISHIMSKEYRIPFIIDDAIIHFDGIRTKRMIELLRDISDDQQIIVFTCKKEIADLALPSQMILLNKDKEKEVLSLKG